MAKFTPGTSGNPVSDVELTISCRNLLDCDMFSKSDPMCAVFFKSPEMESWKEIFRTETVLNNLNPSFTKKPILTYQFEVQQQLRFSIYDVDGVNPDLSSHDFLGSAFATLGQIVSAGTLTLALQGGKQYNKGEVIIKAEELSQNHDEVMLQFHGTGLHRQGWLEWLCSFLRSVNPFLELSKVGEDGEYSVVHRTEELRWSFSPKWKAFSVAVRSLCGGDMDRDIRVRCYNYRSGGDHTLLGEFHTNLNQLNKFTIEPNISFQLLLPEKKKRASQTPEGTVMLVKYEMRKVYSFLDYIMNGTQINCTFAIDFTSSNGEPSSTDSLHYINNNYPNQYEQAIRAVGDIVQDYDTDKMYPVLGFGARLPPDGRISHEFYVNLHPSNPYCEGIDGVLAAYKSCIRSIQLYGPTNFAPVINHVAKFARSYASTCQQYFILLIITDGIITDMEQTKKAIVEASVLPMSIIIVGVGYSDFSAMDELDADTVPIQYNGKYSSRDIVQFVPFREFQNVQNPTLARMYLAKEVLAEIPTQIVQYMTANKIKPGDHHAAGDGSNR